MSAPTSKRSVIGIDLGTTHTALAIPNADGAGVSILPLTQHVAAGEVAARELLPSFVYFAHESEEALALPWDKKRRMSVGEYARARGSDAPLRLISSAKSWLSHAGVDRRASILPPNAAEDIEKISPVEATFRILEHATEAYAHATGGDLAASRVYLTVPASFDAFARELTVEAALAAGLEDVVLLEEPQAALYAWLSAKGEAWRNELKVGDIVLVVDVGGGTTDFSAIVVEDRTGDLELRRVAVGDHILLGGDNMDLLLAHEVETRISPETPLDDAKRLSLVHACRSAKEKLLSDTKAKEVPIALAGRGSKLVGSTLRTELKREDVERIVLEGFFPDVAKDAMPVKRTRVGLRTVGLSYADDAAVTRHLAAFCARHGEAVASDFLRPTCVLFNGGVMKSGPIRERLMGTLNGWLASLGAPPARELSQADYDLAVARGAAVYGLAREGKGVRIRAGAARSYYIGIEGNAPAIPGVEPPLHLLCVVPFGLEEGTTQDYAEVLSLVVGEKATFRFFGSPSRRTDTFASQRPLRGAEGIDELPSIELELPAAGRVPGEEVPVRLRIDLTAIGTLKLFAVPVTPNVPDEAWELEFSVRQ